MGDEKRLTGVNDGGVAVTVGALGRGRRGDVGPAIFTGVISVFRRGRDRGCVFEAVVCARASLFGTLGRWLRSGGSKDWAAYLKSHHIF